MGADRDDILEHIKFLRDDIRQGVQGVHTRLDVLNGRVTANQTNIAVLQSKHDEIKASGMKWGAGVSAAVAGVVTALWQIFGGGK